MQKVRVSCPCMPSEGISEPDTIWGTAVLEGMQKCALWEEVSFVPVHISFSEQYCTCRGFWCWCSTCGIQCWTSLNLKYGRWRTSQQVKVKWSRFRPGMARSVGRDIALPFHDRGTRRGWEVSSTPWPHFTLGKDPVPILQEADWAPGPVWTGGKSRPHRDSIPDRPDRSPVAIPTGLPGPRPSRYCFQITIFVLRWNEWLVYMRRKTGTLEYASVPLEIYHLSGENVGIIYRSRHRNIEEDWSS